MEEPIAEKSLLLQSRYWLGWFDRFVNIVTPPKCLECRGDVTSGASLCLSCWQQLHFISEPVCDALGTPFEYDQGEGVLSAAAIADPPPWDRARAAVAYDEHGRKLVHALKYRDHQEAGIAMARMMTGAGAKLISGADVLLPVPLHRWRLWQRRFNQAAFLAQRISKLSGKSWSHNVLLRVRATKQQVGLKADERRKNVRRAFEVPLEKQHIIDGKSVLLIDDVRTTGATLSACSEVLRKAGAARIDVLTFALVLEPHRPHITD